MPGAAAKHGILSTTRHPSAATLPVMYFGTMEVGWVTPRQVLPWAEGIRQKKHRPRKVRKGFPDALDEVTSHSIMQTLGAIARV